MDAATTLGLGLALISSLAWAGLDVTRKQMVSVLAPLPLVAWLCAGQLLVFLPWTILRGEVPGVAYLPWGLGSLAINVAANVLFVSALHLSPLSLTIPLLALTPVFASAISVMVLGTSLGPAELAGVGLLLVGAGVLVRGAVPPGETLPSVLRAEPGMWRMACVAMLWATSVSIDKGALAYANEPMHALAQTGGVGLAVVSYLGAKGRLGELRAIRRAPGLGVVMVAFALVALSLQLMSLRHLDPGLVETLKRTIGIFSSVVMGRLLFAEPVASFKVVAVAFMVAGTALMALGA